MVDRIELVQNDTGPQIQLTLIDSFTGLPFDLSAAGTVVVLNFASAGTEVIKSVITLAIGPDAGLGQCILNWPAGALDTPGSYVGEVQFKVRKELG